MITVKVSVIMACVWEHASVMGYGRGQCDDCVDRVSVTDLLP